MVIKVQGCPEHASGAVESDGGRHGADNAAVDACCVNRGPDSVDVDANVTGGVRGVKWVFVCVELDGEEAVCALGVRIVSGLEAEVAPIGVARQHGRVAWEEECHAVAGVFSGERDGEGEPRGEAGDLAGGGVVERHRVMVGHPPRAIKAGFHPGATGEVDQVGLRHRIVLEQEVFRAVAGSVGEVEAEGEGWGSGWCYNMVGEEEHQHVCWSFDVPCELHSDSWAEVQCI